MKKQILAILGVALLLVCAGVAPAVVKAVEYDSYVALDNKDAEWGIIASDEMMGSLWFNASGPEFEYKLGASGLEPGEDYSLIYYADFGEDRFDEWGGNNPGALIETFESDEFGEIVGEGSVYLGINLPEAPDANIEEYDYCGAPDYYDNCHGAKVWLVLTEDYDSELKKVTNWNPTAWLFETDLIYYLYEPEVGLPAEGTILPATLGVEIDVLSLDFGSIQQGTTSDELPITIENTGSVDIKVSAYVTDTVGTLFTDCLELSSDEVGWVDSQIWFYTPIVPDDTKTVYARLNVPGGYSLGTFTGTVFFLIQVAP